MALEKPKGLTLATIHDPRKLLNYLSHRETVVGDLEGRVTALETKPKKEKKTKKAPVKAAAAAVAILLCLVFSFGMAHGEAARINIQNVQSPRGLLNILEKMDTEVDALRTVANEVRTDHGTDITWSTEVDADEDAINNYLDFVNGPNCAIGGTWSIAAGAAVTLTGSGFVEYRINGQKYYADLDTTITLEDEGDVDDTKWRAWRIEIDRTGAVTALADGDTQHDEEEIAMMNLAAEAYTANTATLGYFTIDSDGGFNIGTDNVNGETAAHVYLLRGPKNQISGLNAALGASLAADEDAATWSCGTVDANRLGVKLTQIAAIANQAMDDADTIATLKYGAWLIVVDQAGTGAYALAADGAAGSVSAMTYATAALASAAIDTLCTQLPPTMIPIGKIEVYNGTGGTFTAGTTKWDATSVVTTVTDATVGTWDRTNTTGFDQHKITPPTIPASITAPLVGTITAPAVTEQTVRGN